ncbi:MAG: hypothetical protein IBJ11_10825 [Phycisphaerales bacterium]|nr:hypothetical protein [Phycisphaerales bacterium]
MLARLVPSTFQRPASRLRTTVRAVAAVALLILGVLSASTTIAADRAGPEAPAPAPVSPAAAIPRARGGQNVAIITIARAIDEVTSTSFKRRLDQAVADGADLIVVELDTPGGEVGACMEITAALRRTSQYTIAWVNPRAFSAGAIIAMACKEIVVAPGARIGDAAVIAGDPFGFGLFQGLRATERAKALSPVLIEIVDNARANGYDENLATAMVTLGVELWLVEHTPTGRRYALDAAEYRALFKKEPPADAPSVPSLGAAPQQRPDDVPAEVVSAGELPPPAGTEERSRQFRPPGPMDRSLVEAVNNPTTGVQQLSTRPDFATADPREWVYKKRITDGRTLLTITDSQAVQFQLAQATIANDAELKSYTGASNLARLQQSQIESLLAFMTQGLSGLIVRAILLITFLIAMFLELSMPGATLPGVIALLCLIGLAVPPMLIGVASAWWAIAAILAGVALIALEIFVMPGVTLPGIVGIVLLLGGLVAVFMSGGSLFPGQGDASSLPWALSTVLLCVFAAGVGMYFISKYTHLIPVVNRFVLADRQPADASEGMLAAMGPETGSGPVPVGAFGRAVTPLRPSGSAEFGDLLVDVVAEFGFIEQGQPVRVVSSASYRVGVERVAEPPPSKGPAA